MLTRSFIQSILIVTQNVDVKLKKQLKVGLKRIYKDGCICVKEPSASEKEEIKTELKARESQLSLPDVFSEICEELKISPEDRHRLLSSYIGLYRDEPANKKEITEWIRFNISRMVKS
jgi:hypothetical protein